MATVEEIIEKARSLSPAERRKLIEALDRDLEQVKEQDRDKPAIETDREREAERARADLVRRAEAQGITPLTSLEDFAGDPTLTADFDVDGFRRQVREDRDRPSGGPE